MIFRLFDPIVRPIVNAGPNHRLEKCVNTWDLRDAAKLRTHQMCFGYLDSGADDEIAIARSRSAYADYECHYNVLAGNSPDTLDLKKNFRPGREPALLHVPHGGAPDVPHPGGEGGGGGRSGEGDPLRALLPGDHLGGGHRQGAPQGVPQGLPALPLEGQGPEPRPAPEGPRARVRRGRADRRLHLVRQPRARHAQRLQPPAQLQRAPDRGGHQAARLDLGPPGERRLHLRQHRQERDGGVMRGTDIAKALAMGADAVGVGKAYLYGLAAGGKPGVRKAIDTLHVELERAMGLLGTRTVEELKARGPELIKKRQTSEWPPKDYVVPMFEEDKGPGKIAIEEAA